MEDSLSKPPDRRPPHASHQSPKNKFKLKLNQFATVPVARVDSQMMVDLRAIKRDLGLDEPSILELRSPTPEKPKRTLQVFSQQIDSGRVRATFNKAGFESHISIKRINDEFIKDLNVSRTPTKLASEIPGGNLLTSKNTNAKLQNKVSHEEAKQVLEGFGVKVNCVAKGTIMRMHEELLAYVHTGCIPRYLIQ